MGNQEYEVIKNPKRLCKLNETMRSKTIAADQSVVSHDGPCSSANVSTVASNIEIDGPGKIWRNASLLVELDVKDWQSKAESSWTWGGTDRQCATFKVEIYRHDHPGSNSLLEGRIN